MKKVVYAANIAEGDVGKDESELPLVQKVRQIAEAEDSEVLVICAKAEEEIAQLDPEDKQMFLEDMGLEKSGLDRLVKPGLPPAGPDQLPHRRAEGSARLDHPGGHARAAGPPARSIRTLSAASSAPRSSPTTIWCARAA